MLAINPYSFQHKYSSIDFVYVLLPVAMGLMNFTFAYYQGFPIAFGLIMCAAILCVLQFSKIKPYDNYLFIGAIFVSIYPVIILISYYSDGHSLIEFLKSYVLFLILIYSISISFIVMPLNLSVILKAIRVYQFFAITIALLVMAQALTWNVFNEFYLASIFRGFSPLGPGGYTYNPSLYLGYMRPNGLFSEPSIAGWYLTYSSSIFFLCAISMKNNRNTMYISGLICLVAAISTQTLSGVFNGVVLVLLLIYVKKTPSKIILLVAAFIVSWLVVYLPFEKLIERFDDIYVVGSSVYFRVVAPLMLLADSLVDFPFGHVLGSTDYISSKDYMQSWAGGKDTSIENSYFMVSYYFGFVGVVFAVLPFLFLIKLILEKDTRALPISMLLLMLAETGALWSPNTVLFVVFTIFLYRSFMTCVFNYRVDLITLNGTLHEKHE